MNIMHLVKMEFSKILANKKYLFIVAGFAFFNLMFFIQMFNITEYNEPNSISSFLLLIGAFSFMASIVLLYIYPITSYSQDYKNNVLALIIASGVKRRDYFFAKTIVILLVFAILFVGLFALPVVIASAVSTTSDFLFGLEIIGNYLGMSGLDIGLTLILMFVSILSMLMVLSACSILLKGSYLAIILMFVANMINQFVTGIFTVGSGMVVQTDYYDGEAFYKTIAQYNQVVLTSIIFSLIIIAVYGFIAIKLIEKQDL